jgi:hypothetical protein
MFRVSVLNKTISLVSRENDADNTSRHGDDQLIKPQLRTKTRVIQKTVIKPMKISNTH